MNNIIQLPCQPSPMQYANRLKTAGPDWTTNEKRLVDTLEFLEAMIIVLNDVKIKNIQCRDYAMAHIVADEIKQYETRLHSTSTELTNLRRNYLASVQ
jgi:hypothetical protein